MKKLLLFIAALSCFCILQVPAQRQIGNTRDPNVGNTGQRDPHGRPTESHPVETPPPPPPRPVEIIGNPYPNPPCPRPVFVEVPVPMPTQVVYIEQAEKDDAPEVNEIVLRDYTMAPEKSGFDFSSEEVVSARDKTFDVYFSVTNEEPEFVVSKDADIQDVGQHIPFEKLESVPSREWSPTHRVHAAIDNVYIVWTWDNQYYKFTIVSLAENRVSIEWMRMDWGARIAANDDYRNGNRHREPRDKFGQ